MDQWRGEQAGDTITVVIYSMLPVVCLERFSSCAGASASIFYDAKLQFLSETGKYKGKNERLFRDLATFSLLVHNPHKDVTPKNGQQKTDLDKKMHL